MIQPSSSENYDQSQAEIKRLKQKLLETEHAYHLSTQMSQFKAGLLARIAHEIRAPLSTIMSLNQLILTNLCENPEEERQFLTQGQEALSKLKTILDQVIAIAQTENCNIGLEMQTCSLDAILVDVYNQTYLQANNRSLKLELILPSNNIKVVADYQRLLHALIILIDTSISLSTNQKIVINIDDQTNPNLVIINLDFKGEITVFSEPIDLINQLEETHLSHQDDLVKNIHLSWGSKLHLISHLLESMGGSFTIGEATNIKRLQCLLPKALTQS